MSTLAAQAKPVESAANGKQKRISWEEFQREYLNREDGYKYEWLNGEVVKFKSMDYTQVFILDNLFELFDQLKLEKKVKGRLISEVDSFFQKNHRRPDIAYFSPDQIARTAYGENQVPGFLVEVVSTRDQINDLNLKMNNYRDASVEVVWQVYPKTQEVHVFSGKGLKYSEVMKGEDLCSAAPVLPDFVISVNDIFQKPPKPE